MSCIQGVERLDQLCVGRAEAHTVALQRISPLSNSTALAKVWVATFVSGDRMPGKPVARQPHREILRFVCPARWAQSGCGGSFYS